MEAVLKHHAGLAALQENREAVRHEVTRAKAGWGPRVDAQAHIGVGSLSNSTTRAVGADTSFDHFSGASLTVTQPLWDGLATRSRVRSAQATLDSMQERLFDNATTYALDGLIAHLDVIRSRELVQLARKNVARHEKILADTRNREQLGADSMAEVTHTQGRLSRAQSTLTQAELALEEAERNYQRLTGFRPPAHLEPVRMPDGMYDGPADIMAQAEKTNPKLAAYVDDIRAAQADKELAEAARQPVLNLQAGPRPRIAAARRILTPTAWISALPCRGTCSAAARISPRKRRRWPCAPGAHDAAKPSGRTGAANRRRMECMAHGAETGRKLQGSRPLQYPDARRLSGAVCARGTQSA